jgi:hypothetical protein
VGSWDRSNISSAGRETASCSLSGWTAVEDADGSIVDVPSSRQSALVVSALCGAKTYVSMHYMITSQ